MENKHVGWMLVGISVLIVFIIFLFSNNSKQVIDSTCPVISGQECPAYKTIDNVIYLALSIVGLITLVGIFLILSKPQEKIIIKEIEKKIKDKRIDLSELTSEEKKVFNLVKENKAIFQAELIEKTDLGKVKVSRILDRLEGRGLTERKRRGMTNVVVLRN